MHKEVVDGLEINITNLGTVRIVDLCFRVEKREIGNHTDYCIAVSPVHIIPYTCIRSGNAFGNENDAKEFLKQLQELKDTLKLPSN